MSETNPIETIAPARQTALGLYVTAKEAYDMWQADPGLKLLDVRTPEEFVFVGHAPMSMNIPFALQTYEWDPEKRALRWELNPDFIAKVKEAVSPDGTILVMCATGGRGAMACNLLAQAGFAHVWNIINGLEGDRVDDPGSVYHGKHMRNGWKNAGLPWGFDFHPDLMWVTSDT